MKKEQPERGEPGGFSVLEANGRKCLKEKGMKVPNAAHEPRRRNLRTEQRS